MEIVESEPSKNILWNPNRVFGITDLDFFLDLFDSLLVCEVTFRPYQLTWPQDGDSCHRLQELSNILTYCNRRSVMDDCSVEIPEYLEVSAAQKTVPESCKPFRRRL